MKEYLREFSDWAEVWILLIPLAFILWRKYPIQEYLKPVRLYVFIALAINLLIIISWKYKHKWDLPDWLHSNNFLYNTHSIVRLIMFSLFFIKLKQPFLVSVKKWLLVAFLLFAVINFSFFENYYTINMFSSVLLSIEAAFILFYCLQYFLYLSLEEKDSVFHNRLGFWIVTGLTLYEAISFPIFLFYTTLVKKEATWGFAISIWDVHNISFLILCILIAKTFYAKSKQ